MNANRHWTWIVSALLVTVPGCSSVRPDGLACSFAEYTQPDVGWAPFAVEGNESELNVLTLSAGGEFGAYGTGFMRGWAETVSAKPITPARVNVVAGVSTGAIISTHIFLERYAEIDDVYRSVSGPQIYKARSFLGILFSNSLMDASGKDALIEKNLPHEVIDLVAKERRKGRQLLVGTVDLDSGAFLRIDLTKLADDSKYPNRDACYRAAVGAASAIPLAFPPIFVDKRMLVDGGLRHYAFIQNIDDFYKGSQVRRRLFAIYHGDLTPGRDRAGNGVLAIAKRLPEVALDQLLKDTAYRLDYIARFGPEDQRFETYYMDAAAASTACAPKRLADECGGGKSNSEDMFCHPFMECLSDLGGKDGRKNAAENSWLRELMTRSLGSNPDGSK